MQIFCLQPSPTYAELSAEDILFREMLTTKCIQRIRDFLEYVLYKFTIYLFSLLTYRIVS